MNDEELKEMLKLYTKKDLWEFNQIKAKKQIELMAQIKEQDQKIKDLEHRLARCIEPKFEYGQQVFYIANGHILSKWFYECESKDGIIISRYLHSQGEMVYRRKPKDLVFATEEEAKAKLKEIQDEKV